MKKLFILTMLTALCASAQPSTTTEAQDVVALQAARIAALDAQFAVATASYKAQRNNLVRQLDKIQSAKTNAPAINSNPAGQTTR